MKCFRNNGIFFDTKSEPQQWQLATSWKDKYYWNPSVYFLSWRSFINALETILKHWIVSLFPTFCTIQTFWFNAFAKLYNYVSFGGERFYIAIRKARFIIQRFRTELEFHMVFRTGVHYTFVMTSLWCRWCRRSQNTKKLFQQSVCGWIPFRKEKLKHSQVKQLLLCSTSLFLPILFSLVPPPAKSNHWTKERH